MPLSSPCAAAATAVNKTSVFDLAFGSILNAGNSVDVEKTIEFILEQQAHAAAMQAKLAEDLARREKLADRTDRLLDRVEGIVVRETRDERLRRRERRGGNGSQ